MNPEIRKNIAALPFNYSTWAVLILIEAARWWFDLPEADAFTGSRSANSAS